jgi:hypothetical protein
MAATTEEHVIVKNSFKVIRKKKRTALKFKQQKKGTKIL